MYILYRHTCINIPCSCSAKCTYRAAVANRSRRQRASVCSPAAAVGHATCTHKVLLVYEITTAATAAAATEDTCRL